MAKKAPAKAPAKRATPRARTTRRRTTPAMPKARVVNLRSSLIGLTGTDYWTTIGSGPIGPAEAIRVTSILGVVRWIAQAVAIMPIHLMRTEQDGRKRSVQLPCSYTFQKRPNPWQSAYDFYQLIAYWTALHGNGFARVIPGDRGWCSELRPMHPTRVRVYRDSDYTVWYEFWDNDGVWKPLDANEVLHFRWLSDNGLVGLPPAELCETSIALARKLDQAATAFWDNSARPDMVLETDEKIPDEAVVALREAMREVYGGPSNRGKTAVLPKKTRLKAIESNSMEANQFQELRDAILPDVCRCWGVPSTLLGDSKMARWSNVEQEGLFAQTWTLLPWMRRMEGPIDMAIQPVYGEDIYARFDNRGILRGDTTTRVALYQQLFNMGAIRPNEIRDLEDFDLLEGPAANETYMQLGFSTLANAAAASLPVAEPGAGGAGVPEAGGFREGQYVYWAGGEGVIEHLMVDGVLGVEGSPFAIPATAAAPAASIRVYQDGQPTEFTVGKPVAELSAEATATEEIVIDGTALDPSPNSESVLPEAQEGPQIADVSLKGAQVSSLLEIVAQYNAGLLDEQGAKAIIAAAFPGIPASTVDAIIAGTNTETVTTPADVPPPESVADQPATEEEDDEA